VPASLGTAQPDDAASQVLVTAFPAVTSTIRCAPPGPDYLLVNGMRFTGGSFSVRSSYDAMRRLGASGRQMMVRAASARLGVPAESLSTEPGRVIHAAAGRALDYGALAA
jgi:isoquinoline 1-oxidoreductase subunit beta